MKKIIKRVVVIIVIMMISLLVTLLSFLYLTARDEANSPRLYAESAY